VAPDTSAIRLSVAVSEAAQVSVLRVSGSAAFDALDRIVPRELFIRDGQILHSMLLKDDATVMADLFVCRQDESYLLLSEGISADDIGRCLRGQVPAGSDLELRSLDESHGLIALDGPYAWELLAETLSSDVVGLPYLGLFDLAPWLCIRAGKTGEYGYLLLGGRGEVPALMARLNEEGKRFDLAHTDLEALDQCALENGFFNIRREGALALTPIELQLQWRASYQKDYVGAPALRQRRSEGARSRVVTVTGAGPLAEGDGVFLVETPIGRIINAGQSDTRGDWVALAMVEERWAHPGLNLSATHGDARVDVRSVSPPVINNRSLYVHPQRHSYRTREEQAFAALA
jgi:Glycine cleavage system T protein (aminomethyltransferase)